jgi:hypothetical protein
MNAFAMQLRKPALRIYTIARDLKKSYLGLKALKKAVINKLAEKKGK